jgi:hypothetical protein
MRRRPGLIATLVVAVAAAALGMGLARAPQERPPGPLLATSSLGATSAVLFLVDPQTRSVAAYEAIPGESGGLRLLGARKIEHDLELAEYRDLSEFSFFDLREKKKEADGARPGPER